MHNKQTYQKIIINFIMVIMLFFLAVLFLPKLLSFFWPFVVAYLLSLMANPVVRFMEQRIRIKRKHGSAIIISIVLISILGLSYFIVVLLGKEAVRLFSDLPELLNSFNELVHHLKERLEMLSIFPSGKVQTLFHELTLNVNDWIQQLVSGAKELSLAKAGGYVKSIGNMFFMGIITILSTYFFIAYRDKMTQKVNELLPRSVVSSMDLVTSNFRTAIIGYFQAQLKIMCILVVIMFFVFLLLRINYSFFLAVLIGFIDLLPVFGTGLVFWPWAVIDFINGNYIRAIIILGLYLVCQILKQILQPKLVSDSIEINPFAAILFMYIGYRLKGVAGMIIAIPLGMIVVNFYRLGMFNQMIRGGQILIHDFNEYRKY
ncbi:MAG: sporulation integral membrane protein YtvI [Clostridiales bacterium]|nr:sporulation integral membrane protein YtvI [Clostridiales bacterium]